MVGSISQRVALYGRFSDDRQNPLSAIDQLAACEKHAKKEGWQVIHRFSDEAISGAVQNRPGYQKLRTAIVNGDVDIVMAEALDRLSRDQEETANLFKLCLFHEVRIHTISEGLVSELHVGLSSTINAVFLRQLAEKTHRGLNARISAGKSAGGRAYGYKVPTLPNGLPATGDLEIVPEEATVIRRILENYAAGLSPKRIVAALNAEKIPSPSGGHWKANTIHGNRQRGTGILNNELYIGKRIWNRLRYVRKPGERKRISRQNPPELWRIEAVPHLRIIDEALWQKVRARQDRLDALLDARTKGDKNRLSGAHATRRPSYLLSGLIYCGLCGGRMNIGGANPGRYYCAAAREKGPAVCKGVKGIVHTELESLALNGLREHLMQPEAVAQFIQAYERHHNRLLASQGDNRKRLDKALKGTEQGIQNILSAIKAGIYTASTKAELESLEIERDRLKNQIKHAEQSLPKLPDNLAQIYRDKVSDLVKAVNQPETRAEAGEAVRQLIDRLLVRYAPEEGRHIIEIEGDLAALLSLSQKQNAAAFAAASTSLKLVAGVGFEPTTFRL